MKKKFEKKRHSIEPVEQKSLNMEIYSDFSIEELEDRLETGPWVCGEYSESCVRHTETPTE